MMAVLAHVTASCYSRLVHLLAMLPATSDTDTTGSGWAFWFWGRLWALRGLGGGSDMWHVISIMPNALSS